MDTGEIGWKDGRWEEVAQDKYNGKLQYYPCWTFGFCYRCSSGLETVWYSTSRLPRGIKYWIQLHIAQLKLKIKLKLYYDRRSASQSVLEQSTHLGLTTRSWLLSDSCGFVGLGRPLWRENGSAICNCYWPSPAQSFSGPSPIGLVAIFYCLRFETSLFFASYDSQGHNGGIRPRLHTYSTY
jgi:hypothetical protein